MKIQKRATGRRQSALLLIECLFYILLLFLVTGAAIKIFYNAWDENKGLRRDAEDIARALQIGEMWRADLRAASGPVQVMEAGGSEQLEIPSVGGIIVYRCAKGQLRREAGGVGQTYLSNVKSSQMFLEPRHGIAAWRWELELNTVKKTARVRPLFTFEAVPGVVKG